MITDHVPAADRLAYLDDYSPADDPARRAGSSIRVSTAGGRAAVGSLSRFSQMPCSPALVAAMASVSSRSPT
jgi:hypothetical protein